MVVCVILSAYFSATETAFSSLNKTRLKTMAEKGNKRAALACKLSDNYDKLISTILIGNNIVNIAVASIGTVLFVDILKGDQEMGATVSTVVVTVVVVVSHNHSHKVTVYYSNSHSYSHLHPHLHPHIYYISH